MTTPTPQKQKLGCKGHKDFGALKNEIRDLTKHWRQLPQWPWSDLLTQFKNSAMTQCSVLSKAMVRRLIKENIFARTCR